jgi:hypothetical protein
MAQITSHTIVKNEPFLFYTIGAVYNYVDKILLCDTGTDDSFCIEQLEKTLAYDQDRQNKIQFSKIKIDSKLGHQWSSYDANVKGLFNPAATGVETIRQMQIDQTETPFFLILDGDEIHTFRSMGAICQATENWNPENACGFVNNLFMNKIDTSFMQSLYGRLFYTSNTVMDGGIFPSEMHIRKSDRSHMVIGHNSISIPDSMYFHYEKYLKPIRRNDNGIFNPAPNLPEIMIEYPHIYQEYEAYREGKELL